MSTADQMPPREPPPIDTGRLARALAEGVTGWLTFEFHAHRGALFSEGYITPAVGQILQAFANGNKIGGEVTHPHLKPQERGRPYQLDYIVGAADRPQVVIEAKWASWSVPAVKEIVTDLLRLAVSVDKGAADALFILAGKSRELNALQKKLTCLSFDFDASGRYRRVTLTSLEVLSAKAVEEMREIASGDLPSSFYVASQAGRVHADRDFAFKTYVWRIRKHPPHVPRAKATSQPSMPA
jgi:hypothetical protein